MDSNLNEGHTDTKATDEQLQDFERRRAEAKRQWNEQQATQLVPRVPVELDVLIRQQREADAQRRAQLRSVAEIQLRGQRLICDAGARYRSCTLDSYVASRAEQRAIVAALREYIATDFPDNILLYGPVGTGKDHLAFAVCRAAVIAGKTVRWINGQTWFGMVRDSFDDSRKSEKSLVAELAEPELLCLSDPLPPTGPLTQFQATMLYRVVDGRYCRGVPTICTINVHDDNEADERMGEATWDRLTHDAWKMLCNWPTHRQPKREM